SSEILIDEAMKYIEKKKDSEQPFLLVIWYGSPHEPYSGFETDLALYRDLPKKYSENQVSLTSNETGSRVKRPLRDVLIERYAEITAMDRSIGKLSNALKTLELKDNTLLWYCGDNGIPPSGLRESRFRGLKGKVYENGIRVPAVIDWPAGIAKPLVSSVSTVTSDILPTLCKLAGSQFPEVPLDGIDLVPLLEGEMKKRLKPIAFWNFPVETSQGGKPYINSELQRGTTPLVKKSRGLFTRNFRNDHHPEITEDDYNGARAIISGDYKLVIDGDKNTGVELFNLRNDSAESNNLAGSQSVMVEKLKKEMRDWQASALNSLMEADYKSK
ncbi:MAG: sulfatase-like hydrolase/transferase, partial [Opitutae bacterium]|nr:sulfatase-like hydrolase/transferase [Opitutae bacterium]